VVGGGGGVCFFFCLDCKTKTGNRYRTIGVGGLFNVREESGSHGTKNMRRRARTLQRIDRDL